MAAVYKYADWDFERAEKSHRRAIELDPGSVISRQQYAIQRMEEGRLEDAIAQMEIAHDLDPLVFDPVGYDLRMMYELRGDVGRALAYWNEKLELAPAYSQAYLSLGD